LVRRNPSQNALNWSISSGAKTVDTYNSTRILLIPGPTSKELVTSSQSEVVPDFVEVEVAVPHLSPAWW
jgi:hypothetical protein